MNRKLVKVLQKLVWIYVRRNFIVSREDLPNLLPCPHGWRFQPITEENCSQVSEFRDGSLEGEYRCKLAHGEVGYFAVIGSSTVGSVWATANTEEGPVIARTYMKLNPHEALVHDVVTGERYRGKGIGPFMLREMVKFLVGKHRLRRVIVDVSVRNWPSLRMMEKLGFTCGERAVYVTAFGRLVFQKSFPV